MVRYRNGVQDQQTSLIRCGNEEFLDENRSSDCSNRGTGRGTAGREIPVQSVLPLPSAVLSVQVKPPEQATGPLVMRRSQVGEARRGVLVRDTQDRQGPVLAFSPAVWRKFTGQVKAGA